MFTLRYIDQRTKAESVVEAKGVYPECQNWGDPSGNWTYKIQFITMDGQKIDLMSTPGVTEDGGMVYVMNNEGRTISKYRVTPPKALSIADCIWRPGTPHPPCALIYGRWLIDIEGQVLSTTIPGHADYEIPIKQLSSAPKVLDWIFQMRSKSWINSTDVGDLIMALMTFCGRGICGFGTDTPIDPLKKLAELAASQKTI